MHYSNWLIGVKNRASLRNACKTPPNTDCNNRGNVVDVQNNNPLPNEKTSELMVTAHLFKKGKNEDFADVLTMLRQISGPATNNSAWLTFFHTRWGTVCRVIALKSQHFERCGMRESNIQWVSDYLLRSERRVKACVVTKATVSKRAC